jgi:hypothetical protein
MTDGQSASLSCNKAHIWGSRTDFYYCQAVTVFLMWDSLSDERTGLSLKLLRVLASAVMLGSESRGTRHHILLSQIWYFPFRRLLRLAGSRWMYSTPPPHGRSMLLFQLSSLLHLGTDFVENTVHCCSPIVSMGTCLRSRYSVTAAYTCLLRICCLAANISLFIYLFRGRYPVTGLHARYGELAWRFFKLILAQLVKIFRDLHGTRWIITAFTRRLIFCGVMSYTRSFLRLFYVRQTIWDRTTRWLENYELETIRKEGILDWFRYYRGICLKGLRNETFQLG